MIDQPLRRLCAGDPSLAADAPGRARGSSRAWSQRLRGHQAPGVEPQLLQRLETTSRAEPPGSSPAPSQVVRDRRVQRGVGQPPGELVLDVSDLGHRGTGCRSGGRRRAVGRDAWPGWSGGRPKGRRVIALTVKSAPLPVRSAAPAGARRRAGPGRPGVFVVLLVIPSSLVARAGRVRPGSHHTLWRTS